MKAGFRLSSGWVWTMQGRAGKAPKREMVIESPQQYRSLAEIEAEDEAGTQLTVVSLWAQGSPSLSLALPLSPYLSLSPSLSPG